MRTATAIRHVHFEDLGVLGDVLAENGIDVRYVDAGLQDPGELPGLGGQLLIVLGGPIGAYEEDKYPFLDRELGLVERRLAAGLPTLGICLGAQLMARALGARVYPAAAKEIGWGPITLTEEGRRSPIRHLGEDTPFLHWHGDTFDLPQGAVLLASTGVCPHQAFSWKGVALALQFHPEVKHRDIERWLVGHACELAQSRIDPNGLRADSVLHGDRSQARARAAFHEWLEGVGLGRAPLGGRMQTT